jgi:hypothetical protein
MKHKNAVLIALLAILPGCAMLNPYSGAPAPGLYGPPAVDINRDLARKNEEWRQSFYQNEQMNQMRQINENLRRLQR